MYSSFVDMIDIVCHALEIFHDNNPGALDSMLKVEKFANVQCGQLADKSKRNPYKPIEENASLYRTLEMMCKWNVHRVPIVDSSGELLNTLSQSHVVKHLCKIIQKFHIASKTISIKHSQKIREAFVLIREKNVSGIPVLDSSGIVFATISVSDMKLIGYDGNLFSKLNLTVDEWLALYERLPTPIFVTPKNTVAEVAHMFNETKVHRIFVFDNKKLIGLIALGDLMKVVFNSIHE